MEADEGAAVPAYGPDLGFGVEYGMHETNSSTGRLGCVEVVTNSSSNTTSSCDYAGGAEALDYASPFDYLTVKVVFIVLYVAVFICCFFGNLLVIIVVLKHRQMRTITNFFLANLAVADLCVGVFCVLPNLAQYLSPVWVLGKVMCKLYYFVQAMSYTASITILTVISIERYFAIIYPLRSKQLTTMWLLRVTVMAVWVVSAATGVPFLVFYDRVDVPTPPTGLMSFCFVVHSYNARAYATINFITWYMIPLLLMTCLYMRISVVLWRSSNDSNLKAGGAFSKKQSKKAAKLAASAAAAAAAASAATAANNKKFVKNERTSKNGGPSVIAGSASCRYEMVTFGTRDGGGARGGIASSTEELHRVSRGGGPSASREKCLVRANSTLSDEDEVDTEVFIEEEWPSPNRQPGEAATGQQGLRIHKGHGSPKCPYYCRQNEPSAESSARRSLLQKAVRAQPAKSTPCGKLRVRIDKGKHKMDNALLARRRVIRLLIVVILSFALCVLPYHVRMLWQSWADPEPSFWGTLTGPITFIVYYLNSGLNPLLYAFLSERFRQSLIEVITCRNYRARRQQSLSMKTTNSMY